MTYKIDQTGAGRVSILTATDRGGGKRPSFQGTRPSGEPYAKALSSSGTQITGKELAYPPLPKSTALHPVRLTKATAHINLAFRSCREATEAALAADDDMIEKSNAICELREALGRLWDVRSTREIQFGDLVGHLQGLLLEVPPEELPREHIEAIGRVIQKVSNVPKLSDADLRHFEKILIKAGCDVFRALR